MSASPQRPAPQPWWGLLLLPVLLGLACRLGAGSPAAVALSATEAGVAATPAAAFSPSPSPTATAEPTHTATVTATATVTVTPSPSPTITPEPLPLLIGVYPAYFLASRHVLQELDGLENWSGQRLSLLGFFIDLEDSNPAYDLPVQLEAAWSRGSVPVVNLNIGTLGTPRSARALAAGRLDWAGRRWFAALAAWLQRGEGRFVLLSPLPEMNIRQGNTYGGDPDGYQAAFRHLQELAAAQGVPPEGVRWVFAPNGWTAAGMPATAAYYPGDARVDLVGFSAFNWGYCAQAAARRWDEPWAAFGPYLDELHQIAPTKPLLIMQTATTAVTAHGYDPAAKDAWLVLAYSYLAERPEVAGVMYFNINKECDWAVYTPSRRAEGFPLAMQAGRIGYQSPDEIAHRFP